MAHQVARWRHLARRGADLLLCGKKLAIEPCYRQILVPGEPTESIEVIPATTVEITGDDVSKQVRNWSVISSSLNLPSTARVRIWVEVYRWSSTNKAFQWDRVQAFVDTAFKREGDSMVKIAGSGYAQILFNYGGGPLGNGLLVDSDAGLKIVKSSGAPSIQYEAVDDDDNY